MKKCICGGQANKSGFCASCVLKLGLLEKYPVLESVISQDHISMIRSGHRFTNDDRINTICQKCNGDFSITLKSLVMNLKKNTKDGSAFIYVCHKCSKENDTSVSLTDLLSVIDIQLTTERYGGLPNNVKHGKVVAVCEGCHGRFDINASSLLTTVRRHQSKGSKHIYRCFDCGIERPNFVERFA
jgi:hypothetical protein